MVFEVKHIVLFIGLMFCIARGQEDPTTTAGNIGEECSVTQGIPVDDDDSAGAVFAAMSRRIGELDNYIYSQPEVMDIIEQVKSSDADEEGNPLSKLDAYYCSKTSVGEDGEIIAQFAVCNSANMGGCWVKSIFRGAECPTTSLCDTDDSDSDGDADPTFSSDCSGVNEDYPDCRTNCGLDEDDSCGLIPDLSGAGGASAGKDVPGSSPAVRMEWVTGVAILAMAVSFV